MSKNKPGFSDAGKPGNPTALSSHCQFVGNYICNCLFTTLVTRVGYLLLSYSAPVDAIQPLKCPAATRTCIAIPKVCRGFRLG